MSSLRVSLSTDAVIYLPFYLAYFGGDFSDTPFGPVDVSIVGLNDAFFDFKENALVSPNEKESLGSIKKNPRLRGDAFMSLDVLFGVADIGIGDAAFVSVFRNQKIRQNDFGTARLKDYLSYLDGSFFKEDSKIKRLSLDPSPKRFKEIIDDSDLRILGGLIRKPALKAVVGCSKDFFEKENHKLSGHSDKNILRLESEKLGKTYNVFTYSKATTSDFYADNLVSGKNNLKKLKEGEKGYKNIEFGEELENISCDEICISCDFLAIDHKHKEGKLHIIDDFVCDPDPLLWTGIIADHNCLENKKESFQAFLYAIDKNLAIIDQFVNNTDKYGLHNYIKSKLFRNSKIRGDVFKVLIADSNVSEYFYPRNSQLSSQLKSPEDAIIDLFTENLFRWKKNSTSFYYSSTQIDLTQRQNVNEKGWDKVYLDDIVNIFKFREPNLYKQAEKSNIKFLSQYVFHDLLLDWRKREAKIVKLTRNGGRPYRSLKKPFQRFFGYLFINGWTTRLLVNENYLQLGAIILTLMSISGFIRGLFNFSVDKLIKMSWFHLSASQLDAYEDFFHIVGIGLMFLSFILGFVLYFKSKLISEETYVNRRS